MLKNKWYYFRKVAQKKVQHRKSERHYKLFDRGYIRRLTDDERRSKNVFY